MIAEKKGETSPFVELLKIFYYRVCLKQNTIEKLIIVLRFYNGNVECENVLGHVASLPADTNSKSTLYSCKVVTLVGRRI